FPRRTCLRTPTSPRFPYTTLFRSGTLAGAVIPELVKVFTSTESTHVREVVTSSREGGASLNILSGLVAGNMSAFWLGLAMLLLRSEEHTSELQSPDHLVCRPLLGK